MKYLPKQIVFLPLFFLSSIVIAQQLICPPVDKQGKLRIDVQALNILEQCTKQAPVTKTLFFDNKTQQYTPARQELHNKIIAAILKNKPCKVQKPIAIFTGGFPGAGKTTYLKEKLPWVNAQNFIDIDSDAIRAKLPEYKGWNVDSTQPEVKDIVLSVLNRLDKPCRYNLVYDSTLSHTESYQELIAKLKAMDYQIYIVYVETPLNVAIARAQHRYLTTGRYVSTAFLTRVKENGMKTFNAIKNEVDGYIVVDGEHFKTLKQGGKPFPSTQNWQN